MGLARALEWDARKQVGFAFRTAGEAAQQFGIDRKRAGITLKPEYEAENLSMAMSLVASTGGITLWPLYAKNLLSPSVVVRRLEGEVPTIDLVVGYSRSNTSPLLKRFLLRTDEMVARVSQTQSY